MPLNRPLGFGSLWSTPSPSPARPEPQLPAAPEAKPVPAKPADTFTPSPLKNGRFYGDAQLAAVASGREVLDKGAKGASVKHVQDALQAMAFTMPSGVDGRYGPETAQAVMNFQSAAKLPVTGRVDAATLKALDRHAPAPGQTAWSEGAKADLVPDPGVGRGRCARVVVDVSQHRAFLFDKGGQLSKIYGVRTGNAAKGNGTVTGVKVIDGKNNDPTAVSRQLWPGSGGQAFGTRLLNLSDYDVATGRKFYGAHKGQELHGTYQDYSIGRDFSHGCVGLRNQDIEEIFDQVGNGELVKFVE